MGRAPGPRQRSGSSDAPRSIGRFSGRSSGGPHPGHRAALWLGAAVLVMASCGPPARGPWERDAAELPALEGRARALGLPLSAADLGPAAPVPAKDDAAPLLKQAFASLRSFAHAHRGWERTLRLAVTGPTPDREREARLLLARLEPALRLAELAAEKPAVDFRRPWTERAPWSIEMPEPGLAKELVKGLSLRGALRAKGGDASGASRDFRTALALSALIGTEPSLLAGLAQASAEAIAIDLMQWAITYRPEPGFRDALEKIVRAHAARPYRFAFHLRGEMVSALRAAADPLEAITGAVGRGQDAGRRPVSRTLERSVYPPGVRRETVERAYRARVLRLWTRILGEGARDESPLALAARVEELRRQEGQRRKGGFSIEEIALPVLEGVGPSYARREARLRTFLGLLAVLRFRSAHGRDPRTLAEAGCHEVDPFTNRSLLLRIRGKEVRVYSVEDDGIDDGGEEARSGGLRRQDLVSRYPR